MKGEKWQRAVSPIGEDGKWWLEESFASTKEATSCFPGQASPGAGSNAVLTFQITTQHPEEFPGQERGVV